MTIQVREASAQADPARWLAALGERLEPADQAVLARALTLALEQYSGRTSASGEPLFAHAREVAGILAALRLDAATLAAALVSAVPMIGTDRERYLKEALGPEVAALVDGFTRMGQIQPLRAQGRESKKAADHGAQLEALRKMLLAMVQDVRVVLLKLADQTQTLRYLAGRGDEAARMAAARDTFELFAPLANRLGVWQLKWELEDLALRCSEPESYRSIARELDEKRADREAFIARVIQMLRAELAQAGIHAEVSGRPKHIYSIHKKLARKERALGELFDIRGVRVLVDDLKDCYTVLGLVHSLWTPLPKEFDDYIAKPKPNGYRSLHTAVVGPDGKLLEVQIRTVEMHQHSEYGVAAHWRYKEGVRAQSGSDAKIAWLRQILDWRDDLSALGDLAEHFRDGLSEESVYVLTPQGRVIDLPTGATPVDFAYHVHSDVGHRCRGARVDGEMVPLNYALSNGQTVDIVTAKTGGPSRDWLNPELGFTRSHRARAKVRQWFNSQNLDAAIAQGRQLVEKLLQRAGMTALGLDSLAQAMGFQKVDELLAAVGRNELTVRQLQDALRKEEAGTDARADDEQPAPPRASEELRRGGDILVVGVDKLLTVLAKCCKPVPADPIIGFVTRGRGITVHRQGCPNVARLASERLIAAQWGSDAVQGRFALDVQIEGSNHPSLMRDILDVFTREKVKVAGTTSQTRDEYARMFFTLEVSGLDQVRRLLGVIRELPAVSSARRL
ncbi:MAG TPA: bifunctional (p)ppGpp synthetase/guanosine-3',5'-bis(diphosphate) 3'-pyrophosphohydrolase [Burkholderiales bacterium]|nr:bifunctional (p)ppGpp synthetase/guanosine-3',5'-bis(diphosphate) 3'-pyrophosphohydrolase [Burkholderiales bacterium]